MYPLLRMKDLSGIVVILLFFSATRCYIQESYTRGNSCSRDDEIYKNNSNIVFGKSCSLGYDVSSKMKEMSNKLNQRRVISDREILYGEARTSNIKEHHSSRSIERSDVRKDIRSTRDDRIFMNRERNHQDHRETKTSTERRILSRTQRQGDLTSEDSIRISTSTSLANRIVIPRAIEGGNERRSARFFPKRNSDIRSRNIIDLPSQSFERDTQASPSLRKHMVKEEHQERLHRFGNRRQHDNDETFKKNDSLLTPRYYQSWKQANITPESTMEVSSTITFANSKINRRTSSLRNVKVGNKVSDAGIISNSDNFDIRSRSVTNGRQVFERDIQPARFLEIRLAMDKRATSRFIPSRNTLNGKNQNLISSLRQGIERDMHQVRLEKRMVMDQQERRLHRFGNDRGQRENHRVFERNNNIQTIRDSPTQTKRETEVTRGDPMGISTSRNFASRGTNPNTPTFYTIRIGNERTTSRLIPNRNTLNSRNQNLISMQRQGIERDMQQAPRLEKRMVMDQREGRLHRFGNDRRQRENHREFERNNNIPTIRDSPTQTKREADVTREDPMGISTSRNFASRGNNPNTPTSHTILIGNERTTSRLIPNRNTLNSRNQNLISMLRQGIERDMQQARRLEKRMVMDQREGRLHRFGNDRRQPENHREFDRNNNILTIRDSPTQTKREADVTREDPMGVSISRNFGSRGNNPNTRTLHTIRIGNERTTSRLIPNRNTLNSRNQNLISTLRQGIERDMQQARRLEKRMAMDQREGRLHRFGNDRRQRENHREFERNNNILTIRDSPTQTKREADVTREDSMGISTSRNFGSRGNNPNTRTLHTIRIGNERTTSRIIPNRNNLNSRNQNLISTLRQGIERDMQQTRRLEKRMAMDQREGRLHRFGNDRRQRENHREFERNNNILTIRDSPTQTKREADVTREDSMGISTSRNFASRGNNPNTRTLHTIRIGNERTTSRIIPNRNNLNSRNQNLISTLRQGIERDMQQTRRLEKRMAMDQREGRLHRFGNDRRQRENHRVFERNNNILTIRGSPTQTKRESDVTREDPMGISTSRNFATRINNPNTPTVHTIRIINERTNSRLIPSRNTLIGRSQNLIPMLRESVERDILQARHLQERMEMSRREGRLLRSDRKQRKNDRIFEGYENLENMRDVTTQTEREADRTLKDSVGISTFRSFATVITNPRTLTLHTIRIENERTTSRSIPTRNTLNRRNQNSIPMLSQGVEREMQQARHLEKRMELDQREARLQRFFNDHRQRENARIFERNNNQQTIRNSATQTEGETDVTLEDSVGISTSRRFTFKRNNHRISTLRTIRIGNGRSTSRLIPSRNISNRNQNSISTLRQGVERNMQKPRRLEKRTMMDQSEGRIYQIDNDRRQLENNRKFRGCDNKFYIREERLEPSKGESLQRDGRNTRNLRVVADRSSNIRLHGQSANSNTHFFRDSVQSNSARDTAATLVISNGDERMSGPTARNIRFNSHRGIRSRFSESKDYHEDLPEIRQINGLIFRETDNTRRASLGDGRSISSSIGQPIHGRQISLKIHRQNRYNYRSPRNKMNNLSDSTDKIDTQKFRIKWEINEELVASRHSRVRSSLNIENTDSKDPLWSKNLSREGGRNTILSDNRQRNLFEDKYLLNYLKQQKVKLNDQQLFIRDSKQNRQSYLADDIRENERNFGQRKNSEFSRGAGNSAYNVQHISRSTGNMNKNEQSSTGPWFGVIQISFAAIVLGQLIFSEEKNYNRMFSTNVLRKLKSS